MDLWPANKPSVLSLQISQSLNGGGSDGGDGVCVCVCVCVCEVGKGQNQETPSQMGCIKGDQSTISKLQASQERWGSGLSWDPVQ